MLEILYTCSDSLSSFNKICVRTWSIGDSVRIHVPVGLSVFAIAPFPFSGTSMISNKVAHSGSLFSAVSGLSR